MRLGIRVRDAGRGRVRFRVTVRFRVKVRFGVKVRFSVAPVAKQEFVFACNNTVRLF